MLNNKDFCVIIFSHADTDKKEEVLFNSLNSIKKLNLPIILASHIPVNENNQKLCDYFVKDNNNLIINESEIIENVSNVDNISFNSTDVLGDYRFETFIYKKNYQAAVFNLYISSCYLAKKAGFKNAIFWEYDYILGEKSIPFILESTELIIKNKLESISFESIINIFNNDIIQKEISCTYAAPFFVNLNSIISKLPKNYIETSKEYIECSELLIMEQWVKEKVIDNCENKIIYNYNKYTKFLPDTESSTINSQNNYLFLNFRSGLYFSEDTCIVLFNNNTDKTISSKITIHDKNSQPLFEEKVLLPPFNWSYYFLSKDIYEMFYSDYGCKITENVIEDSTLEENNFQYTINNKNIKLVSKLKKFSKI
jgi:hypothetical protein